MWGIEFGVGLEVFEFFHAKYGQERHDESSGKLDVKHTQWNISDAVAALF